MATATYTALTVFFNPVALIPLYKPSSIDESHSIAFNPGDKQDKARGLISVQVWKMHQKW